MAPPDVDVSISPVPCPFCGKSEDHDVCEPVLDGSDSVVRCDWCGREEHPNFAARLRNGWPTCCKGHTMRLIRTEADIEAATRHVIDQQTGRA